MTDKWHVKGNYFESCTCDLVCPCVFLKPPTKGYCKVMVGWQITDGKMGDTDLSGLNVGLYVHATDNMIKGGWKAALYIDARASEEQKNSLIKIYGGEAGGHPAVLASLIGEIMGVHSAKIDIHYSDSDKSMDIEGIAHVKTKAIEGADGGAVTVSNHPLALSPGFAAVVHTTEQLEYTDKEQHTHSGTVGLASEFSYQP